MVGNGFDLNSLGSVSDEGAHGNGPLGGLFRHDLYIDCAYREVPGVLDEEDLGEPVHQNGTEIGSLDRDLNHLPVPRVPRPGYFQHADGGLLEDFLGGLPSG